MILNYKKYLQNYFIEDNYLSTVHEYVRGKVCQRDKEGDVVPHEADHGPQPGTLLQNLDLRAPDAQDLTHETLLPAVELQHLDPAQDLVHQLHAFV